MGFLNPAAWLFGALYAVLVALYLWQRQRRQIDVPSLLLWQDVPEEIVRSSRFQPDLLFFLQLLILTLLIAGLAQPYFERAAVGPQPSRHVFVLDSSASMAAREGRGSRFDDARAAITERIGSLREPDEIMLMTAAHRPRVVVPFTRDRATVLAQLRALIPTDSGTNLSLALVVAQGATLRSDRPAFVHLYTDVPPSELEPAWRETADVTQLGETDDNVGIQAFDVRHDAFGDYRTAYAHLTVRNFAHREAHGFVSLRVAGTVLRRDGFSVPARESRTFLYQDLSQSGVLEAALETDDALAADNHAYAWLRPERRLRLLVVSGPSTLRTELSTIAAATPNIELRFIDPDAYQQDATREADVVLFHRFVPASPPARPQLYVYPPARNPLFPVHAHVTNARVLTWNEAHPAWRDLRPASAFPIGHTQLVDTPPWAELLLSADSESREIPLAFSGERAGQRIACISFDLAREHLVRPDNISLLVFLLNVLDWLAPASDAITLMQTGATQTIADLPDLPRRITDPRGVTAESVSDGPFTVEALYAGVYQLAVDGTRRRLLGELLRCNRIGHRAPCARGSDGACRTDGPHRSTRDDVQPVAARCSPRLSRRRMGTRSTGRMIMDLTPVHFGQLWSHPSTIRVALQNPVMLLFFATLAVPFILRKSFGPIATWLRVAAMGAVVLALAGLHLSARLPDQRHSFVVAIDVSDSVDATGREWAAVYVKELARNIGPEDDLAVLTFAADARIVSAQASAEILADDLPLPPMRSATDIARAIDTAMAIFSPSDQRRLLLLTDGHETRGVARDQIARLRAAKVPIDVLVPPTSARADVALDKLIVPATLTEEQTVPMQIVTFNSGRSRPAVFNLLLDDLIVESTAVDVPAGTARFDFPYRVGDRGHHRLRAELRIDDDAFTSNNARDVPIVVTASARILLITDRDHSPLARVFSRKGIAVDTLTPQQAPSTPEALARYQSVVLEDPTAPALSPVTIAALQRYVHDGGGGLIVAGGGSTFGDERFKSTALRQLLPVTLEPRRPKRTERDPLALFIVIDRSNSMGYNSRIGTLRDGEKLRYAKEAARTVIQQLKDHDLVGVIAFDSQPWEVSPLLTLRENRQKLEADIPRLVENGGTDFFDALVSARKQLQDARVSRRHIILLTDGDTNRAQLDDYARLLADMTTSEITITTVRIGDDTVNLKLLQEISEHTGGTFHHVADAQQLPDLMLRDATQTLEPLQPDSEQFFSQVGVRHQLLRGVTTKSIPVLAGYAYARTKPGADVVLRIARGDRHDPLLAVWQYGLGRVAAFTASPAEDAEAWLAWDELGKFWAQVVHWTGRLHGASDIAVDAHRRDGIVELRVRTFDSLGSEATLRARLNADAGDVYEIGFVQRGPREYMGRLPDIPAGQYPLTIIRRGDSQQVSERTELVHIPAAETVSQEEQPSRHPNLALLTQLVDGTGGRMNPSVRDLLASQPGSRRIHYPLEHILLPLGMLLFLADVAVRRPLRS